MSEYQRIKARALELQREKEYQLKRELARKAEEEKKAAKEEEERRKRIEAATKEARRLELMRANEALHKANTKPTGPADGYDPFAEDAFAGPSKPPPRATPKTTTRPNAGSHAPRAPGSGSSGGTGSKPRAGTKAKPEPAALGRKEKAALKLQREVKQTKSTSEDSLFSVRALVDGRDGSLPGSGASSPRRPPPRPTSAPPSHVRGPASRLGGGGAGAKNSMSQLKKSLNVGELRKLCPDRDARDRRTVDEIQRDIRARKGLAAGASGPSAASTADRDRIKDKPAARPGAASRPAVTSASSARPRPGDRDRDRDADRARDGDRDRERDRGRSHDRRDRDRERDRRRRSPSSSDYESDSPPRRGRRRSFEDEEPSRTAVSAMIQEMFGRGRAPRRYDDDFDSGSDMEAGLSDVELEERRALKIARREDEEAEREENARREAKERAKRMRKG